MHSTILQIVTIHNDEPDEALLNDIDWLRDEMICEPDYVRLCSADSAQTRIKDFIEHTPGIEPYEYAWEHRADATGAFVTFKPSIYFGAVLDKTDQATSTIASISRNELKERLMSQKHNALIDYERAVQTLNDAISGDKYGIYIIDDIDCVYTLNEWAQYIASEHSRKKPIRLRITNNVFDYHI